MLRISEEYTASIQKLGRTDKILGSLTFPDGSTVELSDANVEDGTTSVAWDCVSGEEIEFGSAIISQLNMSIRSELSRYAFYGAKISLSYGVLNSRGEWDYVPVGEFTIAEAERKSSLVKITAYDNLLGLDVDYGGKALYGPPYEIFSVICETCGVELATTEEEFGEMPNGTEKIQVDETSDCKTYRDCAKVVAQMIGCFVVADRNGAIAVKRYNTDVSAKIPIKRRFSTTIADYVCSYMGLRIISSSGEYRSYDVDRQEGLELTINDAPAWDYGITETLQARADTLLDELLNISYTPCKFTMPGDPALECGDRIELETTDGIVSTLITGITWKYHGKMTVKSVGVNPYLKAQTTRKTVVLRELQAQTEENRLIFYSFTNNAVITNSTVEPKTVAQVTFVTIKATSAMFLAQLPITVECEDTITTKTTQTEKTVAVKDSTGATATILDASGNPLTLTVMDSDTTKDVIHGYVDVQVEYYLDGNLVDYELVQRCLAGKHLLSLFYPFEAMDANQNKVWAVKIKVTGGSGTITVAKKALKATITGQGLAGTQKWDGTLTFDQEVPALATDGGLLIPNFTEEVSTKDWEPETVSLQEIVSRHSTADMLAIPAIEERASVAIKIVQATIPMASAEWECEDRYVVIESSGIMARMQWTYESEEQVVDFGRMTAVTSRTDDLDSVESVQVTM